MKKRALLSWSSGKDSAWALHQLRQDPAVEVVGLFTTVNQAFQRVAMHAVRNELLQRQADAAGLPLETIAIPHPCSNAQYGSIMGDFVARSRARGIDHMAFGDLFLEDIRAYRERALAGSGIRPLFPLWGRPTAPLMAEMLAAGMACWVTCVDPRQADRALAGRRLDREVIAGLPATVDPCGENGEFHTFVSDGPMFHYPVAVQAGPVTERDGFVFADLQPLD